MFYSSVLDWIVKSCRGFRLSQRKTLAQLVFGAMRCRRASLADIGRSLGTEALAKHSIKRVYRFLKNHRVDVAEGARALCMLVARSSGGRLFVAVDWTDISRYKVLVATVPLRGRSVPILFAAYRKWQLFKSQNNIEEGFLRLLVTLLPSGTQGIVIADRGFGRAELARTLQEIKINYVIRVVSAVSFFSKSYHGRLDDLPVRPGTNKDLGFGRYRSREPVEQRVVVYWKRGTKEPWFLATDLAWGWRKIVSVYAKRMTIEEFFRDGKNIRYGWGLRQLKLSEAQRLERMLLVLAFAYLLLVLMGIVCAKTMSAAHWSSAVSKRKQTSTFVVGRLMQERVRFRLKDLFLTLTRTLTQTANENWG